MSRKIYDCFIFCDELDTLELRLNILNPVVDHFVLCEADHTHSGLPKPFYFEENRERFAEFLPKIIHLKITDLPNRFDELPVIDNPTTFDEECLKDIYSFIKKTPLFDKVTEPYYGRDFFQKECIRRGLQNCNDDDIIIASDCDEIPNPDLVRRIVTCMLVQDPNRDTTNVHTQFSTFRQDSYYYYLNMFQQPDWDGSRAGFYRDLKHYSYNQLRKQSNNIINNGGWHFSFQGGADKVKKKIESYSHQELNTDYIKSNIAVKIEKQVDPFFRSSLTVVPIDLRFPEYLRNNIDKYKHMIIIKQTIMENKPNFLCISNYNNDISWVKDFPNEHLIYDRSETPVVIDGYHVEQPPNIGYNLYDIFTFIIDHYDSLPDVTTFCKGNVFPRHVRREVFEQLVNSKCFTSIFDVTMHKPEMPMCMFSSDGSWSERNNHQVMIDAAAHPAKYFLTYDSLLRFIFDDPLIPKYITFSPGANYVVPKEYILKYSRTFYENLRFFISHNTLPTETHLIERALYSMWMGNFKASERMADVITDENYRSIFVPPYITGIEEKEKKNGQVDVSAKLSKDANSAGSEIGFYDNLECRFEIVVRDTQHPFLFMSLEQRVLQNKPELSSAFRSNVDDFIKVHKTLAEAEIYLDNDIMPMTTKRLDFSIMKLYVKA